MVSRLAWVGGELAILSCLVVVWDNNQGWNWKRRGTTKDRSREKQKDGKHQ